MKEDDYKWHAMNEELPPDRVSHIEFLKPDGTIVEGKIFIDKTGWCIHSDTGYSSPKNYTHWRFTEKSIL